VPLTTAAVALLATPAALQAAVEAQTITASGNTGNIVTGVTSVVVSTTIAVALIMMLRRKDRQSQKKYEEEEIDSQPNPVMHGTIKSINSLSGKLPSHYFEDDEPASVH